MRRSHTSIKWVGLQPCGSIAYKLALIVAGRADSTFSLGSKNEWDITAGVLLVEESGGRVTDKAGVPFTFNQRHTLIDGVVASIDNIYNPVITFIDRVTD